jgi:glycolate oxidase FAD binding subunit
MSLNNSQFQKLFEQTGITIHSDSVTNYFVDNQTPMAIIYPKTIQELSTILKIVSKNYLKVIPSGGNSRMNLGNQINKIDLIISMSKLNNILNHNPADLTVRVQSGITIQKFSQLLAQHKQFVPIDPPLPDIATIGGTMAVGFTGPLKWMGGNLRDTVIGMTIVEADGTIVKMGGNVVKNVTGYEMSKLHIGGLGTLGIIAEVAFKISPLPHHETTILIPINQTEHLTQTTHDIFQSQMTPLSVVSMDTHTYKFLNIKYELKSKYALCIRLAGRENEVQRMSIDIQKICRYVDDFVKLDKSNIIWHEIANFGYPPTQKNQIILRITSLPSDTIEITNQIKSLNKHFSPTNFRIISDHIHGNSTILCDNVTKPEHMLELIKKIREKVHQYRGNVILESVPQNVKPKCEIWDANTNAIQIMENLKKTYDPLGILNPGRFVGRI